MDEEYDKGEASSCPKPLENSAYYASNDVSTHFYRPVHILTADQWFERLHNLLKK
jgi:hypothetical protein